MNPKWLKIKTFYTLLFSDRKNLNLDWFELKAVLKIEITLFSSDL